MACPLGNNVVIIQSLSCIQLCDTMDYSMPGFAVFYYLPEFSQTHVHWVRDIIQPSHPLLAHLFLPSVFPGIRIFSRESALHIRWPKYWSFSFSVSPFREYSGLISFRMDWFDLLVVQQTQSSPASQFRNINSLVLILLYGLTLTSICDYWKNCSFDYMDLCWQSDISDFFNMLSGFVIAFHPRCKCLLILWL